MCIPSVDPVSLGINALMLGGGTALSIMGGRRQRDDAVLNAAREASVRNKVLREGLDRQEKYGVENQGHLGTAFNRFDPNVQAGALDSAFAAREAAVGEDLGPVTVLDDVGTNNQAVKGTIAKRMLDAYQRATDVAKMRSRPGAYSDVWADNGAGIADSGRRIDTVNNFARGDAALIPMEQDLAAYVYASPTSSNGSTLSSLGNLLAGIGGSGMLTPRGSSARVPGGRIEPLTGRRIGGGV